MKKIIYIILLILVIVLITSSCKTAENYFNDGDIKKAIEICKTEDERKAIIKKSIEQDKLDKVLESTITDSDKKIVTEIAENVVYNNLKLSYKSGVNWDDYLNIEIQPFERKFFLEGMKLKAYVKVNMTISNFAVKIDKTMDMDKEIEIELDKFWEGKFNSTIYNVFTQYSEYGKQVKKILEESKDARAVIYAYHSFFWKINDVKISRVEITF